MTVQPALNATGHRGVPPRPALRYHGGKWMLADWIASHFPEHRVYVEPFGGGGSVLLRKPRSYAEIYNDLDDEVVGLFRILRDRVQAAELERRLRLTPFARVEFNESYQLPVDDIDRARKLIIRSFMGFGSDGCNGDYRTGFRACSTRSGTTPAHDWANYWDAIPAFTARLAGVVIENNAAIETMKRHDGPTAMHYCDPPYMHASRSRGSRKKGGLLGVYKHEMSDADHAALLEFLTEGWIETDGTRRRLLGAIAVSGYDCDLYNRAFAGWDRHEVAARADGARPRKEILWVRGGRQPRLAFEGSAKGEAA